ncbi:hypothetical protein C8R43DRAFT_1050445 [Mycena crocata]|nr:hypothetical protein C8R43DRAFT_1050445 [Mycena crocata]
MAISVEDAILGLRAVKSVVDPEDDYLTLVAAEDTIAAAETKRRKELDVLQSNLKDLSKRLESARVSASRPSSVPSAEAHTSTINQLDISGLSLAKSIKETEGEVASKEGELADMKETARRLEDYDPAAEHEKDLDGTAVRLKFYKQLGFEPVLNKHGNVDKMLVRARSGDVYPLDFNDEKTDMEYTQLLWKLVCS